MLRNQEHYSAGSLPGAVGDAQPAAPDNQNRAAPQRIGRGPASRALNTAFESLLFLVAALVVLAAAGPIAGWWHYQVIESGSMTPNLRVGGVAIVMPEPASDVRIGQVIAYHPPGMPKYARIHRVISLTRRGDQIWVTTKGDANPAPDPGPVRLEGNTAYVEKAFLPDVGYVGIWLYKGQTRAALEGVFLSLLVGGGLWLIWAGDDRGGAAVAAESKAGRRARRRAHRSGRHSAGIVPAEAAAFGPDGPLSPSVPDLSEDSPLAAGSRPPLPRRDKSSEPSDAHVAAGRAASATMAALSNIYAGEPTRPEATHRPAASEGVPRTTRSGRR